MQFAFYYDQSRCIACNACTVSCKDWNHINPGLVRWRHQENHETGNSIFENLSMSCNHCEEPACMMACSQEAIYKTKEGFVLVDRDKCLLDYACVAVCPFGAPKFADDHQEPVKKETWKVDHPMQKCKGCWERVINGDSPVCVVACPTRALDYGDFAELQKKYPDSVRLNKKDFPYAYPNAEGWDEDTKPKFLLKKRNPMKVRKLI